jgi:predicted RNase H-like HicB family nuclease
MCGMLLIMIQHFIDTYLAQARYEMIDGGKRFYAEIKAMRGVWATGETLEECRANLLSALEGWLIFRLRNRLAVPHFKIPAKIKSHKVYA